MLKKIIDCLLAPARAIYSAAKAIYYTVKTIWNFATANHSASAYDSDNDESIARGQEIIKKMIADNDTQIAAKSPPRVIINPAGRRNSLYNHSYYGYQVKNNNIEITDYADLESDDRLSFRSR